MEKVEKLSAILAVPDAGARRGREHYLGEGERFTLDPRKFFQRYPRVYELIKSAIVPTFSFHSWRSQVPDPATHVVLNLGAGATRLDPSVINVDFVGFDNIDVVADLTGTLPIRDASVDAVISVSVLEHLRNPDLAVSEVARILKPGGIFYLATPFLYPYHGAPDDFRRWTIPGLELLLGERFEVVARGNRGGPVGVMILALSHLLAQATTFWYPKLYPLANHGFVAAFSPLKLLDAAFSHLPNANVLGTSYFVTARKKG